MNMLEIPGILLLTAGRGFDILMGGDPYTGFPAMQMWWSPETGDRV
jgi:hypothetical protein